MIYILEIIIIISATMVIININPIISLLYLIALFLSVSLYLIILDVNFVGLSYLLVYIGAVSILFLFILMLIDIRVSELQEKFNNNIYLIIIISIIFINIMYNKGILLNNIQLNSKLFYNNLDNKLNYISYSNWNNSIYESYDLISIGDILYTSHSILIILALLILLLAMVGAIKINIK
jgi:NADH-ubiquinone oxidoreductase chain 6